MTLVQHNEQLVLEKNQLAQVAEGRLGLLGVVALNHGERKKDGSTVYRLSKSAISKLEGHHVSIRTLKSGAVVIEVAPVEENDA